MTGGGVDLPSLYLRPATFRDGDAGEPAVGDAGDAPKADKSGFHLFNPTPRGLMREMSTDRPDKTESAFTVDAGRFQVETDLFAYTFDRRQPGGNGTDDHGFAWVPSNFKVGVLNNVDLQVVIEPLNFDYSKDRRTRSAERTFGFGDVTARLKVNVWGNDGGDGFFGETALAIMPFIKIPTSVGRISAAGTVTNFARMGNSNVEGGIIVPFASALPGDWSIGTMVEVDFLRNERNGNYHAELIQSITVGRPITEKLSGYVELFSSIKTEKGNRRWVATLDLGLTYALTDDLQFDAGINIGVTRAAEDFNPFIGLSARF